MDPRGEGREHGSGLLVSGLRSAGGAPRAAYEKECLAEGREPDPGFLIDFRFHDLRHEATSRLFVRGTNTMTVAAITGHKTLQMLKRYTHLRAETIVGELDRTDKEG